MKQGFPLFRLRPAGDDSSEGRARRYLGLSAAAFLLIFGLLWAYTASLPMAFLDRDYPAWVAKRTLLRSCDLGEISFFGDSRAMASIDPQSLGFAGSNLAFSGSTPIEAYFAAQRLVQCQAKPKAVVLDYSIGNYMGDSDYWNVSARVGILNFAAMREVQAESRRLGDNEISRQAFGDHLPPLIKEALFAARFPSFYFGSLIDGYVFGRYFYNRATESRILTARGHALFGTADGSDALASETELGQFGASPVVNAYFQSLLTVLAQNNIQVFVLSPPINEATCRLMDPSLRPALRAYLLRVSTTIPKVHLLGPTMPCWPDHFFGDGFHFNATGAAAYTKLLAHWLRPQMPQGADSARIVER
jgi:hypothetical protein